MLYSANASSRFPESKFSTFNSFLTLFLKMGQPRPLFDYFDSFHMANVVQNFTINDKSIDGVLGTRTLGSRMVDADKSTQLSRQ